MRVTKSDLKKFAQAAKRKGQREMLAGLRALGVLLESLPEIRKSGMWDESQHPRDDHGRWIQKNEIAAAAKNPNKLAQLMSRVTDPQQRAKLSIAIRDEQHPDFASGVKPESRKSAGDPHESPKVHDTVELIRSLQANGFGLPERMALAQRLKHHDRAELELIQRELGVYAVGRKADMVNKIILQVAGISKPEQGFTGKLVSTTGQVLRYENGQLVEKGASREGAVDRMSVDEAEAMLRQRLLDKSINTVRGRQAIAHAFAHQMSYRDLKQLKERLGLKASGNKLEFIEKILDRAHAKDLEARQHPDHPANKPDPIGTFNTMEERNHHHNLMRLHAGPKDRQAAVQDAGERLQKALKSPFTLFSEESATEEVRNALQDLVGIDEFNAAVRLAGFRNEGGEAGLVQRLGRAFHKKAVADAGGLPDAIAHIGGPKPEVGHAQLSSDDSSNDRTTGQSGDSVASSGRSDVPEADFPKDAETFTQPPVTDLSHETTPKTKAPHTHAIYGDTFPHKDLIKKLGGDWDPVAKQWTIDAEGAGYLPKELRAIEMKSRAQIAEKMKPTWQHVHPDEEAIAEKFGGKGFTFADGNRKVKFPTMHDYEEYRKDVESRKYNNPGDMFDERTHEHDRAAREAGAKDFEYGPKWSKKRDSLVFPTKEAKEAFEAAHAERERKFDHAKYERLADPEHVAAKRAELEKQLASIKGNWGSNSYDQAMIKQKIAELDNDHQKALHGYRGEGNPTAEPHPSVAKQADKPTEDPTPGRTESLKATLAGADAEKVRDAEETVSRIEDIPVGERTADHRAELKEAKKLVEAKKADDTPSAKPSVPVKDEKAATGDAFADYVVGSQKTETVKPKQSTGDPFADYVVGTQNLSNPPSKTTTDEDLEAVFGMKTVAQREREEAKQRAGRS